MADVVLKTVSTVDALCEMISDDIYSLRFVPGSRITEKDLVDRYGVSRNTIRESIAFLLANGLLIRVANKGVLVRDLNLDDVREIFHLRFLLESEAIRSICESGVIPIDLIQCAEEVASISLEENWQTHLAADIRFHEKLIESAHSIRLMRLYKDILAEVKLCVYQSHYFIPLKQENSTVHLDIIRAMENDNMEEALCVLRKHLDQAVGNYQIAFTKIEKRKKEKEIRE